jgi:hypothetical protein
MKFVSFYMPDDDASKEAPLYVKVSELRELLEKKLGETSKERIEMETEIKDCDECFKARELDIGNLCNWHTGEEAETLRLIHFIRELLAELEGKQ